MRRAAKELIRTWTEALVPVCNNSRSHADQEVKWLLLHSKQQSYRCVRQSDLHAASSSSRDGNGAESMQNGGGLSSMEIQLMQSYVDQRVKARKPLQYIIGTQPFMDLEILVRPPTLIPRWETEEWTSRLALVLKSESRILNRTICPASYNHSRTFNILDLCAGSGCVSLGLASSLPVGSCNVFGVDVDPMAIELARENEVKNRSLLNQNRVVFRQSDLLAPTAVDTFLSWLFTDHHLDHDYHSRLEIFSTAKGTEASRVQSVTGYNLVVSNPPYIARSEYETLEPEVALWEDPKALLADEEGLAFYPRLANLAMELLHRVGHPSGPSQTDTPVTGSSLSPVADSGTRLDSETLERLDRNGNGTSDSSIPVERQWENGPNMDVVKVPELVLEIGGDHQAKYVADAVRRAGFRRVEVWKDLADRARCIVGAR
ncbi:hypothetical protein BGX28_003869 [Mortierella sp. GBA30]|nr:hypothetical protein BGX28_003869 [Mortierella sp. GBA30]